MPSFAQRKYREKVYQNLWCKNYGGLSEYVLFDNTRVDCLLQNYAVEFDFANKWAEAIGQSLYYSIITRKRAGVVLIMENEECDEKYLARLKKVAKIYGITVWTVTSKYIEQNCN